MSPLIAGRTPTNPGARRVQLRDVRDSDPPIFFDHQQDPEATRMAAFTVEDPTDRDAFMAHWYKLMNDRTIVIRTIVTDGQVAGHVLSHERCGEREVSYWIERALWGHGIATAALAAYLALVTVRPLYARAAKDNVASIRVLEKCGFRSYGTDTGYANARGAEITEILFKLEE